MIRVAAVDTNQRKRNIMEMVQKVNHNQSPELQSFNIEVGKDFIKVSPRLLPPPIIEYRNGKMERPAKGVWQMMRDTKFYTSIGKWRWSIINTDKYIPSGLIQTFAREVCHWRRSALF